MSKQYLTVIKLQIKAGLATSAPPIGSVLGQKGINIKRFCQQFNDQTKTRESVLPLSVDVMVRPDRSFNFIIKEPPVSRLILKYCSLDKGSSLPGSKIIGKIKKSEVNRISKIKISEITGVSLHNMNKMVIGTARSMGINLI